MKYNEAEAIKSLDASLLEQERLRKLSNEDLVMECVRDRDEGFSPVVEEMCHRLFPGWLETVEGEQ